jgi:signal transduction histidine kinase
LILPLVVSLFTAGVNYGVWFHRKSAKRHLTLAYSCVGCALTLVGNALLYFADSREEAIAARVAMFLCIAPIQFVNLRLSAAVYGPVPNYLHGGWISAFACALLALVPGLLYAEGVVARSVEWLGIAFVDTRLTPLGVFVSLTPMIPAFAHLWHTARAAHGDDDRSAVVVLTLIGVAPIASDSLVYAGMYDAPLLFPLLWGATTLGFSALMLRHFVDGVARVESSADALQRAAEARARELRETDLRLAHGAKLAALGTLAASLAHEINNPAAFIRSNLNYLGELAERSDDDAEFEEVLAETEQGVERLRNIVAELREMSDPARESFGEVALSDIVEAALPTLRFEARADVALEARLAPVPAVRGDRNLLGQVLANLVINAIHSVRGSGVKGVVSIATFADDRRAVIEVADSGPGIPPELRARIFEPFFTTKPAGEGTGLGLAMARQLVERHGGRLTLAPSERGARFQVELPLARVADGGASRLPRGDGA